MRYQMGLNQDTPLAERMSEAINGSRRLHLAAAYAKSSGVGELLGLDPPKSSRMVLGLGFGLTDPAAVDRLDEAGFDVRVVPDGAMSASAFHPKLSLIERPSELITLSGSGNLTGGGWRTNVEQFEELHFDDPSKEADDQRQRFEQIWDRGHALRAMKQHGDWDRYRDTVRDRRRLDRAYRMETTRFDVHTGSLIGRLANATNRGSSAPGWIGRTHPDWWDFQVGYRDQSDTAAFGRGDTRRFRRLQTEGLFFHLVKRSKGAPTYAIEGWSVYSGRYEVGAVRSVWRRHGLSLGAATESELRKILQPNKHGEIGVIHLLHLTEFVRPISDADLRKHGVLFDRHIEGGRGLTLEEVGVILRLSGLNETSKSFLPDHRDLAAE